VYRSRIASTHGISELTSEPELLPVVKLPQPQEQGLLQQAEHAIDHPETVMLRPPPLPENLVEKA